MRRGERDRARSRRRNDAQRAAGFDGRDWFDDQQTRPFWSAFKAEVMSRDQDDA